MNKTVDNHAVQGGASEGFYSRWSKRKVQAQINQHDDIQMSGTTDTLLVDTQVNKEASPVNKEASPINKDPSPELNQDKELLRDKDMPDLDTLDEDSDYSGFLSPGVSEKLRKLALRKLFQGQSFNLCDGLDDYDEEFTSFEKLGDIVTADMRFQLEEEAKRKLQLASENDDRTDAVLEETGEVARLNEDGSEKTDFASMDEPQMDETADMDGNEDSRKPLAN